MSMPHVPMDITEGAAVRRMVNEIRPEEPIRCSALEVVDATEDTANQPRTKVVGVDG